MDDAVDNIVTDESLDLIKFFRVLEAYPLIWNPLLSRSVMHRRKLKLYEKFGKDIGVSDAKFLMRKVWQLRLRYTKELKFALEAEQSGNLPPAPPIWFDEADRYMRESTIMNELKEYRGKKSIFSKEQGLSALLKSTYPLLWKFSKNSETENEVQLESGSKNHLPLESKNHLPLESKNHLPLESKKRVYFDFEVDPKLDSVSEFESESDSPSELEFESEPCPELEPELEFESEPCPELEPEPYHESEIDPYPDPNTVLPSESEPYHESELYPNPEPIIVLQPRPEPKPQLPPDFVKAVSSLKALSELYGENNYTYFGIMIANEMNEMPLEDAIELQSEIQKLISETRLNHYSKTDTQSSMKLSVNENGLKIVTFQCYFKIYNNCLPCLM